MLTKQEFIEKFGDISSLINLGKNNTEIIDCKKWGQRPIVSTDIPFEIKNEWVDQSAQLKILLAHFSPFKHELEGIDYPLFLHKILPNSVIHLTYDKGDVCQTFAVENGEIKKSSLLDSYDIIIGRSSVFNSMHNRKNHANILKKSGLKVQIKAMGIQNNHKHCDYVFDDKFLFTPPSPIFRSAVEKINKNKDFKKHPFVLFLGVVSEEKNQLNYLKMIDPDLMRGKIALIVGDIRQPNYVKSIENVCNARGIDFHLTGKIDFEIIPCYTAVSSIHVINCDPRNFGQDYDPIPRCIGETIVSNMHTACSKTTLTNDDMAEYVTSYDHENANILNSVFESIMKIDASSYSKNLITLERKSYNMTSIILSKMR